MERADRGRGCKLQVVALEMPPVSLLNSFSTMEIDMALTCEGNMDQVGDCSAIVAALTSSPQPKAPIHWHFKRDRDRSPHCADPSQDCPVWDHNIALGVVCAVSYSLLLPRRALCRIWPPTSAVDISRRHRPEPRRAHGAGERGGCCRAGVSRAPEAGRPAP